MPPADPTREMPQIYLITPPDLTVEDFPDTLARVLDGAPIACLRLSLATSDEDRVARAADALREVAHARDVPLVIETHLRLVDRLGLDGVHLTDAARTVRHARKELGPRPSWARSAAALAMTGWRRERRARITSPSARLAKARWEPARRPRTTYSPGGPR